MNTALKNNNQHQPRTATGNGMLRRWRALLLGLLLIPVNVYLLLYIELGAPTPTAGTGGPRLTPISLFANTIIFLILIVAVNRLVHRVAPDRALNRPEILIVQIMLIISTSAVSIGFFQSLVPMMTYAFRFASPENGWSNTILPNLPSWAAVSNPDAVKAWYEGGANLYKWNSIRPWLAPIGFWTVIALTLMWVMFCISVILRKQWISEERLAFPIVELPWEISDTSHKVLQSKLLWLGFGIAAAISIMNGLHILYPSFPEIDIRGPDLDFTHSPSPWNGLGRISVYLFPFVIGLGFLMPADILGSSILLFFVWKAVAVASIAYGVSSDSPNFPYLDKQTFGGYIAVALFSIWAARRRLASILRSVLNNQAAADEGPISYRVAVGSIAIGVCALAGAFGLLGLSPLIALVAILLYFLIALSVTRIHAEFGAPFHGLYNNGPEMAVLGTVGTQALGTGELTGLGWFWWFNRGYAGIPMACQMDAMKLADKAGISNRRLVAGIAIASVAAIVSGFWVYLHLGYKLGASAHMSGVVTHLGREAYVMRLDNWIRTPSAPDTAGMSASAFGMAATLLLYIVKTKVMWWPIHPLSYPLAASPVLQFWIVPWVIAWTAKIIVLRTGGLKLYRVALGFFLGLILGDFVLGCMWPIVGAVLHVPYYNFMD